MRNNGNIAVVLRNCDYCGKEFEAVLAYVKRGNARFCSRDCGSKNSRTRVPRVCEVCGNGFEASACEVAKGQGRFCSRACFGKSKVGVGWGVSAGYVKLTRNVTCDYCGKKFDAAPHEVRAGRRFCSRECCDPGRTVSLEERFWKQVEKTETCWLWTGAKTVGGYGKTWTSSKGSKPIPAHRVSWEIHHGRIPKGLFICHRCDVPLCVNPDHLFLGTAKENSQDMWRKGRQVVKPIPLQAKLTEFQVKEIRRRHASGESDPGELAKEFGVSKSTVFSVVHRKSWKHVE